MRSIILALLLVEFAAGVCHAKEARLVKGDVEAKLTENGLAVTFRGTPIICGSHLTISKPEWKGTVYSGRNYLASKTAKVEVAGNRIAITDTAPEIGGQIAQEICLEDSGLLLSLKLQIANEIPPSPVEFVPAVFPEGTFAGGKYRLTSLLGLADWQALPAEKPEAKGPGTQVIQSNLLGLGLAGKGTSLAIQCGEGPPPSFYDMRSREYPPPDKNYWLLYSWKASKGEVSVQVRISLQAEQAQASAGEKGKVEILEGDKRWDVCAIAVDAKAHEIEKAAAYELRRYLFKISGAEIPIVETVDEKRPFDKGVIYVGRSDAAHSGFLIFGRLYTDDEMNELGADGFVLRSKDGNLLAAGKNHRGTVYAVYRLLERIGCRFVANELEIVPSHSPLLIPGPFNVTDRAAFEWRAMLGTIAPMKCGLSPGEWEAKVGDTQLPKMMAKPPGGFWHHTMGFLLPAEELAKAHPEYLAQIGGKREPVGAAVQQYCLSNPGLLRAMSDAVLAWIASEPDKLYYPVHYGDVVKFCECDQCKALYEEKGSVTDAVIWFDNQIAKEVAQKFPGKFVTILAYHSTRRPPVKVKPESNLLIIFCAIVECQGRPWSHPVNMKKNVCQDLEAWIALHPLGAKGIITFDYPTTYHFAGFPYPALYAHVGNIRYYKKLGLRGVYICGLGNWKHLEHLYSYVIPRIMWNPHQDMGALIDEFCQAWYGAAAKPMREYIEMLHRGAMESKFDGFMDCHAGPGQKFFRELYTPQFFGKAYDLFEQAESLAENDIVKRRIAKEKWGVLFTDLFLYGQTGGDLVPAPTEAGIEAKAPSLEQFKKVSEFFQITRLFNRPWDMEPRRKFTLTSIVGIEPGAEPWWANPRIKAILDDPAAAFEKESKAGQAVGQHLVTLDSAHLKAVLVPKLGGRIWRLYHKATRKDILWRGPIPLSALDRGLGASTYVNLGGYEEYTGEKFGSSGWAEAYTCQTSPDGRTATLTASLPIGLRLTRRVTLSPDKPEVEVESVLENASPNVVKGVMLRVHPQFALGQGMELCFKRADGSFKAAEFKQGENFFAGDQRPSAAWAVTFAGGVNVVNEFDPAQVGTCFFYAGPAFCNLELFSPKKDLAPGEKIQIKHRYRMGQGKLSAD
ncbi:MAG: DUF4838 domain-containing protein [Planctomycetota bacterium]